MEAVITLTDNEDGTVKVAANFGGNLDDTSPAHKAGYHMLSSLKEVLVIENTKPESCTTDAKDKA